MKLAFIQSLVASLFYFILTWVGFKLEFLGGSEFPIKDSLLMAAVFFVFIFIFYYITGKKKSGKKN